MPAETGLLASVYFPLCGRPFTDSVLLSVWAPRRGHSVLLVNRGWRRNAIWQRGEFPDLLLGRAIRSWWCCGRIDGRFEGHRHLVSRKSGMRSSPAA